MKPDNTVLEEFDPLRQKNNTSLTNKKNIHENLLKVSNIIQESSYTNNITDDSNKNIEEETDNETRDINDTYINFKLFIEQLRYQQADPIIKYSRSFLHNFCTQRPLWTVKEQVKLINDFKIFIFNKFKIYEPFKSLDSKGFKNAQEGMEKLIMGKLYFHCFSPLLKRSLKIDIDKEHGQDLIDDIKFTNKCKEYRFIEIQHLENDIEIDKIPYMKLNKFVELGCDELNKINRFKSPRDKILCILNCCKVVYGLLKHIADSDTQGADNFIPLLIYIVLRSNVKHLISNIRYINRFRYSDLNTGEELYYLSSLQGAIKFIELMTPESLNISNLSEFNQLYNENQFKLKEEKEKEKEKEKEREKRQELQKNQESLSVSLDDLTTSMATMFSDLISSYTSNQSENSNTEKENGDSTPSPPVLKQINTKEEIMEEERAVTKLIEKLETKERQETLKHLTSMFPDLDEEIIKDVCIAKKYNIGKCVDSLLSLFN